MNFNLFSNDDTTEVTANTISFSEAEKRWFNKKDKTPKQIEQDAENLAQATEVISKLATHTDDELGELLKDLSKVEKLGEIDSEEKYLEARKVLLQVSARLEQLGKRIEKIASKDAQIVYRIKFLVKMIGDATREGPSQSEVEETELIYTRIKSQHDAKLQEYNRCEDDSKKRRLFVELKGLETSLKEEETRRKVLIARRELYLNKSLIETIKKGLLNAQDRIAGLKVVFRAAKGLVGKNDSMTRSVIQNVQNIF